MIFLKTLLFESPVLVKESKQSIINIGFPSVVVDILFNEFGKNAYLIAKWFKDYYGHSWDKKNWFREFLSLNSRRSLLIYIDLYESSFDPAKYLETLKKHELSTNDFVPNEIYLKDERKTLYEELNKEFLGLVFFRGYNLIKDIREHKLKDIKPYEKLSFQDAILKYDERRIFKEMTPIKTYPNGFQWISVGSKCELLGHYLKNCGSAGLMSWDEDKTLIGLFDSLHKPHVVVTYSPNEHRISGDEGVASTAVKEEYHDYVLDLAKILNARFDTQRTKSKLLKLKYSLKDIATDFQQVKVSKTNTWDNYFRFRINGEYYYSNGKNYVSLADINKAYQAIKNKSLILPRNTRNKILDIFNPLNMSALENFGVRYNIVPETTQNYE